MSELVGIPTFSRPAPVPRLARRHHPAPLEGIPTSGPGEVAQDGVDDVVLRDHRDGLHRLTARGAQARVDLKDAAQEWRPTGARPRVVRHLLVAHQEPGALVQSAGISTSAKLPGVDAATAGNLLKPEHPGPADLASDALHSGVLGPIERGHWLNSFRLSA